MIEIISINESSQASPLLSIGIPTYPARKTLFDNLCQMLLSDSWRYRHEVEIIGLKDDKTASIGEKRNMFMDIAKGKYLLQVDDDDSLVPDYFDVVMPVLKGRNPDCIGHLIDGEFWIDGEMWKKQTYTVSKVYNGFQGTNQGTYYKVPIKADICRKERFKPINYGEDSEWMKRLKRHLKTEVFIKKILYRYRYETFTGESHEERYGIK